MQQQQETWWKGQGYAVPMVGKLGLEVIGRQPWPLQMVFGLQRGWAWGGVVPCSGNIPGTVSRVPGMTARSLIDSLIL
jgi:hypothetical protein